MTNAISMRAISRQTSLYTLFSTKSFFTVFCFRRYNFRTLHLLSWHSANYIFFQLFRHISTQNYNRKIIFECDSFRWSYHCFILHFWFSPLVTMTKWKISWYVLDFRHRLNYLVGLICSGLSLAYPLRLINIGIVKFT